MRILGITLPENKRIEIALTAIYGIGRPRALYILKEAKVGVDIKSKDLNVEQENAIRKIIEGFKIIDMPNILLGGGPGTATQSMTLQAYIDWNTLNLGRSAAIAYLLLILVSVVATVYVSFVRRRVTDLA